MQRAQVLPMVNEGGSASADEASLRRLLEVLDEFRAVNPDVTANQIMTFIHIAMKPGISQPDLATVLEMPKGSINRIVAVLSDRGNRGAEGYKLVDIVTPPEDYRQRNQFLSFKGRKLFDTVKAKLLGKR